MKINSKSRLTLITTAAIAALAVASFSYAGDLFTVSATITSSCTVNIPGGASIPFGSTTITPYKHPTAQTQDVTVNCTGGATIPGAFTLNQSQTPTGIYSSTNFVMQDLSAAQIPLTIHDTTAGSPGTLVSAGVPHNATIASSGDTIVKLTVAMPASLPAAATAGAYSDTITFGLSA